jgi:hypothetical protein
MKQTARFSNAYSPYLFIKKFVHAYAWGMRMCMWISVGVKRVRVSSKRLISK